MVAGIIRIQSSLDFLLNQILRMANMANIKHQECIRRYATAKSLFGRCLGVSAAARQE
jgi:hypothetical protein